MSELYHYTCGHGARFIRDRGATLLPTWQPMLGLHAAWATDMAEPEAEALGLTSTTLSCDRTAHRFAIVELEAFTWWPEWWPRRVDPRIVSTLGHPPLAPRHWWITTDAVHVRAPG